MQVSRTKLATPFLIATASAILLAGCAGGQPVPVPSYTPSFTPPPATSLAPLRGTTVPADSLMNPALSAKVDNHEEARPQYGLGHADIVFEELVEGGLTRYVAIWQSDIPAQIGPVRSIRPMDPDIITPFGGIVTYSGGQQRFVEMMLDTPIYNIIDGSEAAEGLLYRTDDKDAPHNVGVAAQTVISQHMDMGRAPQMFAYSSSVASSSAMRDGAPGSSINVRFSDERYPTWTFDAGANGYLRFQEGSVADMTDEGGQITATNVVVMMVGIDWEYSPVPRTIMVDSGEVWVSTGGKTIHGTWAKDAREARIRLIDDFGMAIRLAPGNTWIEMPPREDGSVTVNP